MKYFISIILGVVFFLQGMTQELQVTYSGSQIPCSGQAAYILLTITGGTPPYSVSWQNNDALPPSAVGVQQDAQGNLYNITSPDNWTYTVQDATGGIATASVYVPDNQMSGVNVQAAITNASCDGPSDGKIKITEANGDLGFSPYEEWTYKWYKVSDPIDNISETLIKTINVSPANADAYFDSVVVSSGQYKLLVTSISGCVKTYDYTVGADSYIEGSSSFTNESCPGADDAQMAIDMSSGTAPYTYLWEDGTTENPNTNIDVNLLNDPDKPYCYTVTVTDNAGCKKRTCVGLTPGTVIAPLPTINYTINKPTCGENNGSINVGSVEGINNYTLLWSNGTTGNTLSNIGGGNYSVVLKNTDNDCSLSFDIVVENENPFTVTHSSTKPSCYKCNDGSINLEVTGGTEPYSITWSNGSTESSISDLYIGSYSVTVSDASNCTDIDCINLLSVAPSIEASYSITKPTKCDTANGIIELFPSGGVEPYTYLWSNGATTARDSNLAAGFYTCTITDSESNQLIKKIALGDTDVSPIVNSEEILADCNQQNGAINVNYSAPEAILDFNWSNGGTTPNIINLNNGIYTLLVKKGICSYAKDYYLIPPELPVQDICIVTVDSATTNNLVVWENNGTPSIDHYNVYKKDCGADYSLIGTVAADAITVFEDVSSFSYNESSYYRIKAVDSCGVESPYSPYHKTIHLNVHKTADGSAIKLFWDDYEGFNHSDFHIYRKDEGLDWALIASVNHSTFNYIDNTASATTEKYAISIDKEGGACDAWNGNARTVGGPYYKSNSNIEDEGLIDTKIERKVASENLVHIFPNPSSDKIKIKSDKEIHTIKVFDMKGRLVKSFLNINRNFVSFSAKYFASGYYIIKVEGAVDYEEKILVK